MVFKFIWFGQEPDSALAVHFFGDRFPETGSRQTTLSLKNMRIRVTNPMWVNPSTDHSPVVRPVRRSISHNTRAFIIDPKNKVWGRLITPDSCVAEFLELMALMLSNEIYVEKICETPASAFLRAKI